MAIEGMGVLLSRKVEIDEALRHPEIFSSNMDAVDLKNKRPHDPPADRSAGAQEVPQAARPDLRPAQDGAPWRTRWRAWSTT